MWSNETLLTKSSGVLELVRESNQRESLTLVMDKTLYAN